MRTSASLSFLSLSLSFIALAGFCEPASAEWKQVVTGVNSTAYADESTIRRNGDIASMRVLVDYPKPPFDGNNLPYRSLTMQGEYHCEDGRFRVLAITSHSANMGRGERPYTTDEAGEWEQVTETSLQRDPWKLACAKNALPAPKPSAPAEPAPSPQPPPGDTPARAAPATR